MRETVARLHGTGPEDGCQSVHPNSRVCARTSTDKMASLSELEREGEGEREKERKKEEGREGGRERGREGERVSE